MKITSITRGGVIGVDAYTRDGVFQSLHPVDVAFDGGGFMRIPAGFWFNGASIPPRARSIIQSLTIAGYIGYVVHDYPYAIGATWITPSGARIGISRRRADWIALALSTWLGLAVDDQLQIYAALRALGGASYRRLPVTRTREQLLAAMA